VSIVHTPLLQEMTHYGRKGADSCNLGNWFELLTEKERCNVCLAGFKVGLKFHVRALGFLAASFRPP